MFSEKLLNVFYNTSKCFSEDFSMFFAKHREVFAFTPPDFARFLFERNRLTNMPGELDFTLLAVNFKPAGHGKIFPAGQFGVGRATDAII
ncbi:MAG: hypothetical protein WA821_02165 [Anaerolineales bacterium]